MSILLSQIRTFRRRQVVLCLSMFVLVVLSLSGCVDVTVLNQRDVARVNSTRVRAFLPQEKLRADIVSAATPGDLRVLLVWPVIAAIDSSAQNAADQRVESLRMGTRDLDMRRIYWQAISNAVSSNGWLKVSKLDTLPITRHVPDKGEASGQAILDINTEYFLTPNCRMFVAASKVYFYLPGETNATGLNQVVYYSHEWATRERAEAIDLWTTNKAAAYRRAISESAEATTKLLQKVFERMGGTGGAAARPADIRGFSFAYFGPYSPPSFRLHLRVNVLEETPERLVFQTENGSFFSYPRDKVRFQYLAE